MFLMNNQNCFSIRNGLSVVGPKTGKRGMSLLTSTSKLGGLFLGIRHMFWQSIGMCTSVYHKQLPWLEPNNLCLTIELSLRKTLSSDLQKSRDKEFLSHCPHSPRYKHRLGFPV